MVSASNFGDAITDGYVKNCKLLSRENEVRVGNLRDRIKQDVEELKGRLEDANGEREEIRERVERYERLGKKLSNFFIRKNMNLAISFKSRYGDRYKYLDDSDVFSECQMTLLKCYNKWDQNKGNKFSTYAMRAMFLNLRSLNRSRSRVFLFSQNPFFDEAGQGVGNTIVDESSGDVDLDLLDGEMRENVKKARDEYLDEKEKEVVNRRFGLDGYEPGTLKEVGRYIGLTREAVRQIQIRALNKIRDGIETSPDCEDYLD